MGVDRRVGGVMGYENGGVGCRSVEVECEVVGGGVLLLFFFEVAVCVSGVWAWGCGYMRICAGVN